MRFFITKTIWKIIGIGVVIIVVLTGVFIGFVEIRFYKANLAIKEANKRFNETVEVVYDKQKDLDVGEATPFGTLYRYTELLQVGADKVAATYFIKEERNKELYRLIGVSEGMRWDYIKLLKADQEILNKIKNYGDFIKIDDPLPIIMKKAINGVWQIESINYNFNTLY